MAEFRKPTHAEIQQRAYELFVQDGCEHGLDVEHWLCAENELNDRALEEALRSREEFSIEELAPELESLAEEQRLERKLTAVGAGSSN
jgi:Protein of unknown function (DUF2934)